MQNTRGGLRKQLIACSFFLCWKHLNIFPFTQNQKSMHDSPPTATDISRCCSSKAKRVCKFKNCKAACPAIHRFMIINQLIEVFREVLWTICWFAEGNKYVKGFVAQPGARPCFSVWKTNICGCCLRTLNSLFLFLWWKWYMMVSSVCIWLNVLSTAVNIKQPMTRPIVFFSALTWFILRVNKVNHYVALQPVSALRGNITDNTANSLLLCTKTQSESTDWCAVFTVIKT